MDKIFDYEDIHQKKIAIRQDVESFKKEEEDCSCDKFDIVSLSWKFFFKAFKKFFVLFS